MIAVGLDARGGVYKKKGPGTIYIYNAVYVHYTVINNVDMFALAKSDKISLCSLARKIKL